MRGGERRWNVSNDASARPRPALGLVFSANEQRTATRGEGREGGSDGRGGGGETAMPQVQSLSSTAEDP